MTTRAVTQNYLQGRWMRKPGILARAFRAFALLSILLTITQISFNFVIHLINVENANPYLFVARFTGLTIYLYITGMTLIVARMSRTNALDWKTFDVIMLLLALFAFSGVVIQKVTGPLDLIGALAVVAGTLAFALKFCKMTSEYYALRYAHSKT